MNSKIELTNA